MITWLRLTVIAVVAKVKIELDEIRRLLGDS